MNDRWPSQRTVMPGAMMVGGCRESNTTTAHADTTVRACGRSLVKTHVKKQGETRSRRSGRMLRAPS